MMQYNTAMKNYYVLNKKLDICDVAFNGKTGITEIMSLFQRAVTLHTLELGVDFESVKKNHNAKWFISSAHIEVYSAPSIHDEVIVKTWPLAPSAVRFPRAFELKDSEGRLLAAAMTEWCTVDYDSGKLLRSSVVTLPVDEYLDKTPVAAKVRVPETDGDAVYDRKMLVSDLDVNGHVNNVSYIRFALDAFSSEELSNMDIKSFDIEYKTQAFEGDTLTLYKSDDPLTVTAKKDGITVFTAAINL